MDRINVSNPVAPVHPVQTVASFSAAPDSVNKLMSWRAKNNTSTHPAHSQSEAQAV